MAVNTALAWIVLVAGVILTILLVPGVLVREDSFAQTVDTALLSQAERLEQQLDTFSCDLQEDRQAKLLPPGTPLLPTLPQPERTRPNGSTTEVAPERGGPNTRADDTAPPTAGADRPDGPTRELVDPDTTPVPDEVRPDNQRDYRSVGELIEKSVYFVFVPDVASGTAFAISDTHLVTNQHVVDGSDGTVLVINEELDEPLEAKVLAQQDSEDRLNDFAILEIAPPEEGVSRATLPLVRLPERNEDVLASGYPGWVLITDGNYQNWMSGGPRRAPAVINTRGIVMAVQNPDTDYSVIVHSAEISGGNSGGPLIDQCGRVGGVNTFIRSEEDDGSRTVYYALPSERLISFLGEHGIEARVVDGVCGVVPRSADSAGTSDSETPEEEPG